MNANESSNKGTVSLLKTLCVAIIIGALVSFLATFWTVYQSEFNTGFSSLLPWALGYGLPCLGFATFAIIAMNHIELRAAFNKAICIVGIVAGSLYALTGFPLALIFASYEFMISMIVIGGCIIAIGVVSLKSHQED